MSAPVETFRLIRSRRRTLSLQLAPDGGVLVRAPLRMTEAAVRRFVEAQRGWIERQERRRAEARARSPFADLSEALPYAGRAVPLAIDGSARELAFDGERFTSPPMTPSQLRIAWAAWCKKRALEACARRATELAAPFGLRPGRVSVRDAKSRWGSCAPDGRLMFNWKLVLAAPEALDYVVAHELAHLVVRNHSRRFWAAVARILPGHESGRRWLRAHGRDLLGS